VTSENRLDTFFAIATLSIPEKLSSLDAVLAGLRALQIMHAPSKVTCILPDFFMDRTSACLLARAEEKTSTTFNGLSMQKPGNYVVRK
jgi:hypothetical protein